MEIVAGTTVEITQNKGGFITVYANGNLFRVEKRDFDAIGVKLEDTDASNNKSVKEKTNDKATRSSQADQDVELNVDLVWEELKTCYDPEIPVNIVDLGLIYGCKIIENKVIVSMTLTAPNCGMGPVLMSDIRDKLMAIAGIEEVEVDLVFDPPWTTDRMSEAAKIELGLL
jgi:probable FeS assembly SUF system protein SufT